MAMAEAQIFGEAPVFATTFEERGIILVKHQLGELLEEKSKERYLVLAESREVETRRLGDEARWRWRCIMSWHTTKT